MKRSTFALVASIALAPGLHATDYHVDAIFGSDLTGTGTIALPWRTLTFAAGTATQYGDTISVRAGVHNVALGETFPILLASGITLLGAGPHLSVIDGAGAPFGAQTSMILLQGDASITGFRFKNGPTAQWWDAAITSWTAGTFDISNNVFEGPMNRAVILYDLTATPTSQGLATVTNNIVFNVGPADGILVFDIPQVFCAHNTIARGDRSGFAVSQINTTIAGVIANNIIFDANWFAFEGTAAGISLFNNDLWLTQGTINGSYGSQVGTLNVSPMFFGTTVNDFRLRPASPLKDAGINALVGNDHDGQYRPSGAAPDVGADEIHLPSAAILLPFMQNQTTRLEVIGGPGKPFAQWIGLIPATIPTPYGWLAFDPAYALLIAVGTMPAGGVISTSVAVPPAPAAVGFPLVQQTLVGFQSNSFTDPIFFTVIQ